MKKILFPRVKPMRLPILPNCFNFRAARWLSGVVCLIFLLLFVASSQSLYATEEPVPTPVIEAPPAPPLAISPPVEVVEEAEEEDRSLFLLILIIVVSSATALAVGFYIFRKLRQFLAKRKKKAAKQAKK